VKCFRHALVNKKKLHSVADQPSGQIPCRQVDRDRVPTSSARNDREGAALSSKCVVSTSPSSPSEYFPELSSYQPVCCAPDDYNVRAFAQMPVTLPGLTSTSSAHKPFDTAEQHSSDPSPSTPVIPTKMIRCSASSPAI
jgi:hypothetical protein